MKMGARATTSAAVYRRCQSSSLSREGRRSLERSTLPQAASMRCMSCSLLISSEKTATGTFWRTAALSAMHSEKAVLPILGRAATMIRSEAWSPAVSLSRRV